VIVLGPQEIKSQVLKIKKMATRTEIETNFADLASTLKSLD
jgi:histidyl-tRNA synthetase